MEYKNYIDGIKKNRKSEVINTACDLFLATNIETVKMTEIAEKAKLGVASLYRYFGTKEEIVIQVGERLWNELYEKLSPAFESDEFTKLNGNEQIVRFLGIYEKLYKDFKSFVLFISDFDNFCLKENISKERLANYEKAILSFYPHFEKSYQKGLQDKTIKSVENVKLMYVTVNHTLMALVQKIIQGEIISSDSFDRMNELKLLIKVILQYIKN